MGQYAVSVEQIFFTQDELFLIKSALRNDTVGSWGDRRQAKINSLLKKLGKAGN